MPLQKRLYDLFLLDQRVRGLSSRLNGAKRRLRLQQVKLDQLKQQAKELDDELKRVGAHAATLENEAASADARITELREKMNNVNNNKEYSALLVEVNTLKVEQGKMEDEALKEMEARDRIAEQFKEQDAKVVAQEKLVAVSEKDVVERQAEVGDQLEKAIGERDTAATDVPADALAIFERAADSHDGEAMVPVEEANRRRKEYNCGGCFIGIPFERFNTLVGSPDILVQCPNCERILFVEQELRESVTSK